MEVPLSVGGENEEGRGAEARPSGHAARGQCVEGWGRVRWMSRIGRRERKRVGVVVDGKAMGKSGRGEEEEEESR